MTPDQRKAARERCAGATPEPWEHYEDDGGSGVNARTADGIRFVSYDDMADGHTPGQYDIDRAEASANAAFIAHARTDLPAALDALDAADAENARLRAALAALAGEGR